jgi:NADPH:quinone reductase-like Zn-dependent oxidoreductase
MSHSVQPVRTGLLERLLGTSNYNVVLAVSANIISWIVATLIPSKLPHLLPYIPEEEKGKNSGIDVDGSVVDTSRTRCVAVGRPGGTEQLRIIRLKEGYVTCGYNLPGYDSPFVDISDTDKLQTPDGTTTLIVLRICAFSINYADCCIRWGLYESANRFVGYPIVPGFDVAGVVEKVIPPSLASLSSPPPFKEGDRVYGATFFGAYSTRCLIPSNQLRKMPEGMSFAQAAALPAVSLTALYALHLGGRFSSAITDGRSPSDATANMIAPSNRSILIHSAAGGVGSMMVQMAKLLGLSPVVGVVGRTSKVDEAKALGCDAVIDKQSLREESSSSMWDSIKAVGPREGFSIIADPNGVSTLQDSFDHLCPSGRLVAYGFHSNLPLGRDSLNPMEWVRMVLKASKMPAFDPMELVTSNKSVMGFNLSFFVNEIEMLEAMYDQIERWMSDTDGKGGLLRCPRVTEMAMDDIREAHQLIQSGKTVGKLVMIAADDNSKH